MEQILSSERISIRNGTSVVATTGTRHVYGAKGYLKFTFGTIVRSFFVVRVKKGILRAVTLSINKAFIKPILTFWPF